MRWARAFFILLQVAQYSACRDIVGFDDSADTAAGEKVPSNPEPLFPGVPAKAFKESCEQCVIENCARYRDKCLEDDVCRNLLECNSRCKDPVCFARCGSFMKFGGLFSAGSAAAPESIYDDDYRWCIGGECSDACGIGLNWECLQSETYRWPKDSAGPLPVQLSVSDEFGASGFSASVEARDGDALLDRGETGGWGQVELDVNSQYTFTGYFLIVPKIGGLNSTVYYPPTLFRRSHGDTGVVKLSSFSDAPDAQLATAAFTIRDCVGAPASGVSFEIDDMSPQSIWVADTQGPTPGMNVTNQYGTVIFVGFTPKPGRVNVRAVRRDRIVARRTVELRAGLLTRVDLMPLSGDE